MKQNNLNCILEFIQDMPDTEKGEQVTAAVLKLAADNAALKAKQKQSISPVKKEKNYLKFTKQEIDSMPESIKVLLIYSGNVVTYRFHNGIYHARYRRDGYNIEVAASDLKTLKYKFLEKLETYKPKPKENKKYPFMKDFVEEWLKMKKISVKASTFKSYRLLIESHVIPVFGDMRINVISRSDIQGYLNKLVEAGKNRTANKLKQLLSAMFDVAVSDFDIKSPMEKIVLPHYEVKKGAAFTKEEEKQIVDFCRANPHYAGNSGLLVLLYTGMRVGELASLVRTEKFILCISEKTRKGYADVTRKIPITPMLKKVLPLIDFEQARKCSKYTIRDALKRILPDRHVHELRYTFITRAKECYVSTELVMLWDGHTYDMDCKSSRVDRGYTTYSDEFMLKEAEKIDYEL